MHWMGRKKEIISIAISMDNKRTKIIMKIAFQFTLIRKLMVILISNIFLVLPYSDDTQKKLDEQVDRKNKIRYDVTISNIEHI